MANRIAQEENAKRDRALARALSDAYQKGWDARSTGRFFADDIRPSIPRGRKVSVDRVVKETQKLRVPSDRELGPWSRFVKDAIGAMTSPLPIFML
jgi:hypothetical protein